jgi:hypothetical protein
LKERKCVVWTNSFTSDCFPEERITLVWIHDSHAVDFDKDEVLEFLSFDGAMKLCDNLANGGGLPRTGRAGDVDARAGAVGDGGGEVGVHFGEFIFATREGVRDGGDVEGGASKGEGGGVSLRGESAEGKGSEFEGGFDDDAAVLGGDEEAVFGWGLIGGFAPTGGGLRDRNVGGFFVFVFALGYG